MLREAYVQLLRLTRSFESESGHIDVWDDIRALLGQSALGKEVLEEVEGLS